MKHIATLTLIALVGVLCGVNERTQSTLLAQRGEQPVLEIPFRYEGLMFADVQLNDGKETYNFLIDSGASTTVLSTHVAEELGLEAFDAGEVKGVGTAKVQITMGVDVGVGDHTWADRIVAITDLSSMADVLGKHMDGILGSDWMLQFGRCHFDFLTQRASFYAYSKGAEPKKGVADLVQGLGDLFGPGMKLEPTPAEDDPLSGEMNDLLKGMLKDFLPDDDATRDELVDQLKQLRDSIDDMIDLLEDGEDSGDDEAEGEEPFSYVEPSLFPLTVPKLSSALLAQDTLDPAAFDTDLEFKMVEASIPFMGSAVVVSLWFTEVEVDGDPIKVIFDTGAMPLLVLDDDKAKELDMGRSYSIPISGVGSSEGTMAIANHLKVGDFEEFAENPATILDLDTAFGELRTNPVMGMLGMFGVDVPQPVGILGLPFALRYRSMLVNHETMTLSFQAYTGAELASRQIDPNEERPLVLQSVKNAWAGVAGDPGFEAYDLSFEDWEAEGIEGGLVIESVERGSSAQAAGLGRGDIIYAFVQEDPSNPDAGEVITPLRGVSGVIVMAAASGAGAEWTVMVKKKASGEKVRLSFALEAYAGTVKVPARYEEEIR